MGVSKAIYACQGSNKHDINIIIYKHTKHAIDNEMKACKQYIWELEIYTKTDEDTSLILQTKVVLPPKHPLKVMHPNSHHEARNASTPRYGYSHVM